MRYSVLAAPLLARQTLAAATSKPSDGRKPLTFKPDGTFHISILEDLHFGHSELSVLPRPTKSMLTYIQQSTRTVLPVMPTPVEL